MRFRLLQWFVFLGFLCAGSCTPDESTVDDILLARVYDRKLYLSDIQESIPAHLNATDSVNLLRKLTNEWVEDALFLREAEMELPDDVDIKELVREYRSSLIRHYYEKKLIDQALDTQIIIQDSSILINRNDEKTETIEMLSCIFLKIKKPVEDIQTLNEWWKDPVKNRAQLLKYCQNNAVKCHLNPGNMIPLSDIRKYIPRNMFSFAEFRKGTDRSFADFNYQYYIKIIDRFSKTLTSSDDKEVEQMKKLILRQRKDELIRVYKQNLFNKEIRGTGVEINIK